jgi:hypothetical protein
MKYHHDESRMNLDRQLYGTRKSRGHRFQWSVLWLLGDGKNLLLASLMSLEPEVVKAMY